MGWKKLGHVSVHVISHLQGKSFRKGVVLLFTLFPSRVQGKKCIICPHIALSYIICSCQHATQPELQAIFYSLTIT